MIFWRGGKSDDGRMAGAAHHVSGEVARGRNGRQPIQLVEAVEEARAGEDVLRGGARVGARFASHYDVTPRGNFEATNILNRLREDALADAETEDFLARCRARLFAAREPRVRPGRDDKVLADWNGLAIAGLANAGAALGRPAWVDLAARTFDTAAATFRQGDRLIHAVRGHARLGNGFALDYAASALNTLSTSAAPQT